MPASLPSTAEIDRPALLRSAIRLTYLTLVWMSFEALASLSLGWASSSLLLEGFGVDSLIELFSSAVLLWRLRTELDGYRSEDQIQAVEVRATQLVGSSLYALSVYVCGMSAYGLWVRPRITDTHESAWGIAIGLVAKVGMPILAGYKLKLAAQLNSKALRADAVEALTCGYLSLVLMVGLAATRLFGWWWLDSVAALALVPLLLKEAGEAVHNRPCHCTRSRSA